MKKINSALRHIYTFSNRTDIIMSGIDKLTETTFSDFEKVWHHIGDISQRGPSYYFSGNTKEFRKTIVTADLALSNFSERINSLAKLWEYSAFEVSLKNTDVKYTYKNKKENKKENKNQNKKAQPNAHHIHTFNTTTHMPETYYTITNCFDHEDSLLSWYRRKRIIEQYLSEISKETKNPEFLKSEKHSANNLIAYQIPITIENKNQFYRNADFNLYASRQKP